ncbi:MAG: GAF domain-containing protein, partial [Deltaproteobacteria bacterium]|nr:GAF domain-containing protein [Deltaproteobacteria bacterium]
MNNTTEDAVYVEVPELASVCSALAVPLRHRDAVIGVLDVEATTPDAFDELDLHLLETIAALVAPAVHTARMYERERRRVRHLNLANEISKLVMSSLDREQLVSMACRAMLDTLDISFVAIVLLDSGTQRVLQGGYATRNPFVEGLDFERWSAALGEGIVSEVIRTGEPMRLGEVSEHPAYREVIVGARSHLSVPLRMQGETIGALVIEHTEPNRFTHEDESLLENISAYLVQAIDNARLFDGQRRRWLQLLLINEVARVTTRSVDLEQILSLVAREVHERFGYFAAAVMLREEKHVVLRALAAGGDLDIEVGYREPVGEGIAGTVAATGRTMQVDDAEQLGSSLPFCEGIQSALCVPLPIGETTIGVLEVQSVDEAAFTEDDRLVLETLAKSVAGAVANARAIREKEQLREDLNRMVVHDLRNPVQAVQLTLQEVLSEDVISERTEASVHESITGTEEILDMVNSLLDLARFEAGQARIRPRPAAINDHVRAAIRRGSPAARAKGIQVTSVLSQDVPVMRVDQELIDRMLSNLIGNALKFTPEGGTVTIQTEPVEERVPGRPRVSLPAVLVTVKDTGEGIPVEFHEKIFEKFGQVESRKAGLKMSTGLGLALCRYVVEAHEGAIWVESVPGEGSAFYALLPARRR